MLRMFNVTDSIRSIVISLLGSRHVRNVALISALLTLIAHRASGALPRVLRPRSVLAPFAGFAALFWLIYYEMNVPERPQLTFSRTPWNESILERLHIERFRPVPWGVSTHVQTVVCNSINKLNEAMTPYPRYQRETIAAWDGNRVCLDWATDASLRHVSDSAPVVYIEHGLAGSPEDNYCRNLVALCVERGWRAVVHFRWRLDYAAWQDCHRAVQHIAKRYPAAPIVAVGFSAGAHVLLAYLAALGSNSPLLGSCIVSPALDLVKMISWMETAPSMTNPAYANAMESMMRSCVRRHAEHDLHIDQEGLRQLELLLADGSRHVRCHWLYDKFLSLLRTYAGDARREEEEEADLREARAEAASAQHRSRGTRHGTPLFSAKRSSERFDGRLQALKGVPRPPLQLAGASLPPVTGQPSVAATVARAGALRGKLEPELHVIRSSAGVDVLAPLAASPSSPVDGQLGASRPGRTDDTDSDAPAESPLSSVPSGPRSAVAAGPAAGDDASVPGTARAPARPRRRQDRGGGASSATMMPNRPGDAASTTSSLAEEEHEAAGVANRVSAVLGRYANSPEPIPLHLCSPFGHGTSNHYLRTAGNTLDRVGVPTLVLMADDDQLMPPSFAETLRRGALTNPNIIYARTARGGHCAWHEGIIPTGASYSERLSVSFMAAVLAAESHTAFIVDVVKRSGTLPRVRSSLM